MPEIRGKEEVKMYLCDLIGVISPKQMIRVWMNDEMIIGIQPFADLEKIMKRGLGLCSLLNLEIDQLRAESFDILGIRVKEKS